MASSGGTHSTRLSDRQSLGLLSLAVGVVLFAVILMRGEQAAREGDVLGRRDTYWVLVSPLVFSVFGVSLLRLPPGGGFGGSRRSPQPVMMRPQVRRAINRSVQTTESAQVALARVENHATQQLAQARQQANATLASVQTLEQERDRAAAEAEGRIRALEQQLVEVQHSRDVLELDLQRLTASRHAEAGDALAAIESVGGQVDALSVNLQEQISNSLRQLDDLIARHEEQLQRLRSEASEAQSSLSQLRSDYDVRLQRVKAEAAEAISSALVAQDTSKQLAATVGERMACMDERILEAQQTCTRAEATLSGAVASTARVHSEARASAVTAQRLAEDLGLKLSARMDSACQKLEVAVQANQEAQAMLESQLQAELQSGAMPDAGLSDLDLASSRDPSLRC